MFCGHDLRMNVNGLQGRDESYDKASASIAVVPYSFTQTLEKGFK